MKFRIVKNENGLGETYYIDDIPVTPSTYFRELHMNNLQKFTLNEAIPKNWDKASYNEEKDKWEGQYRGGMSEKEKSDGLHANYYTLPYTCSQLQDLISHRNMNAQIGEIFRECYRYGLASHSDELRGIKKILFYANAELKRLENANH